MIYGAEDFWSEVLKNNPNIVISFALFCPDFSLGYASTPVAFVKQLSGDESFLYSQEEFKELVMAKMKKAENLLSERVCDEIFKFTHGYPYLVYETLNDFIPWYLEQNALLLNPISEETFYTNYLGQRKENYLDKLSSLGERRCFKTIEDLLDDVQTLFINYNLVKHTDGKSLSEKILKHWLQTLVFHDRIPDTYFHSDLHTYEVNDCYRLCLKSLINSCVVIKDEWNDECYFYEKIFRYYYTQEYLKFWHSSKLATIIEENYYLNDFNRLMSSEMRGKAEFVRNLIKKFDSDWLKINFQTRSFIVDAPFDYWVNTGLKFLGFKKISSQIYQNINGYIEINDLKVRIQVMRNGQHQTEHIDRLHSKDRKYQNYLIIDFHKDADEGFFF